MSRAAKVAALALARVNYSPDILWAASSVELWINSSDEAGVLAGAEAA